MRLLHTMLRVGDLNRSIAFYTEVLGMQLLRRSETPTTVTPWRSLALTGATPAKPRSS